MNVFPSYRIDDSLRQTRRVVLFLKRNKEIDTVFFDKHSIEVGTDFCDVIDQSLDDTHVGLVMIGPKWLDMRDQNGNLRLFDPSDVVVREITGMIDRGITIFPVTLDGAEMPSRRKLPKALRPLTRIQAFPIRKGNFDVDCAGLAHAIVRHKSISSPGWQTAVLRMAIGSIMASVALLVFAAVHKVIWGRPLDATLGDKGPVVMILIAGPLAGAAIGGAIGRISRTFRPTRR